MMQKQIEEFRPRVFTIKSSTFNHTHQVYFVTNYRPNIWGCTCRDYIYRSHDSNGYSTNHKCRHIKEVIKRLKDGEDLKVVVI
jgi:hypothetical protein